MPEHQARFPTVVAKAGKPTLHLAWLPVEKDPGLKAALASNRVMTVHQVMRGGRKDYATVGFIKGPQTQLLIFPKSLRKFTGQRIVAIDYDLFADPAAGPGSKETKRALMKATARPRQTPTLPVPNPPLPVAETKIPSPRQVRKVESLPEEPLPLTWGEALLALSKMRRDLKGRVPAVAAQLDALSLRMKDRLRPH